MTKTLSTILLANITKDNDNTLEVTVAMSLARTGMNQDDMKRNLPLIVSSIKECFPDIEFNIVLMAIKKGSHGYFGKTFGSLTAQEVCIWIRRHHTIETNLVKGLDEKGDRILTKFES